MDNDSSTRFRVMTCVVGLALVILASGCRTVKTSDPPRTAVEQLLLSTAANDALRDADFAWLGGRRVFLEDKYFESYDKGFAVGAIRERLAASGALLSSNLASAEVVVEIRSGVLSVHSQIMLFGLPAMGLPIPITGTVETPELAIYKSDYEDSIAKFHLFAYERESGKYIQATGPMLGHAHHHHHKIIFISWRKTTLEEVPTIAKFKAPHREPSR